MASRRIRKVLIANRGEIAVRVIRSCAELGIATVAVYSDADRGMPHVLFADEAVRLGPPPSRASYLAMDKVIDAARRSGADALHPGYGFLSENAEFARRVADAGLVFVGPGAEAIRTMGDKTEARRIMRKAGVPVVPGTDGPAGSAGEVEEFAAKHGFPVILKAAGGGGGKGMRVVRSAGEIPSSLASARSEAGAAFGDARVYVERYLDRPRHVEIQILADHHGSVVHLGERECSIQRRHQKIVEESPSVAVDDALRTRMGDTAICAARACGYRNAGTVEFLLDADGSFYFLEMNTRLQVEHPVTELRTGLDLVALQLRIAGGEPLPFRQEEVKFRGHAIECRICAEDVANDFLPSTGTISHLRPASGPGIREDRGIEEGGEIPIFYDSMVSKLIAWAPSRAEAMERMRRALDEYEILGVRTNIPVCRFVMEHPDFRRGDFDTHFLTRCFRPTELRRPSANAEMAAAILTARREEEMAAVLPGPDGEASRSGLDWVSAGRARQGDGAWKRSRRELLG